MFIINSVLTKINAIYFGVISFLAAVLPLVLVVLCAHSVFSEVSQSTNSYLSVADRVRLKNILDPGFQLQDIPAVYYAVDGYKFLGETIPKIDVIFLFHKFHMFKKYSIYINYYVMKKFCILRFHDYLISLSDCNIFFLL